MMRQEFDNVFRPMCKALNVSINQDQAKIFWEEFQRHDHRDFAHACRELSMGQPGYLPKLVFFRDNVLAAKEMRQARETVPYVPDIDPKRIFSQWREQEPEMAGKSDWEKGQVIMQAIKGKMDRGEAVYTLREEDTFAFWNEPIPLEQKEAAFGRKEPLAQSIQGAPVTQYRWVKAKMRSGSPTPKKQEQA
jgi:hypothetical protein